MSYGAVVHASVLERRDASRAKQRLPRAERERRVRAAQLVWERLPDLRDGHGAGPCNFAVLSVLLLWAQHGEGNVRPSMVRSERRRLIERNGWEVAA